MCVQYFWHYMQILAHKLTGWEEVSCYFFCLSISQIARQLAAKTNTVSIL